MKEVEQLRAREPIFHRPELGLTRGDFEAQTADDYWEVGASGASYTREFIWSVLAERYTDPTYFDRDTWTIDEFEVRELSDGVFLTTYLLDHAGRLTRRSTIWRRHLDGWQAIYHQGTVATVEG